MFLSTVSAILSVTYDDPDYLLNVIQSEVKTEKKFDTRCIIHNEGRSDGVDLRLFGLQLNISQNSKTVNTADTVAGVPFNFHLFAGTNYQIMLPGVRGN